MSTASPTFSQLKAQVAAIRQKVPQGPGNWYPSRRPVDRRAAAAGR